MGKTPLYKQIQKNIRDKIIAGELRPKDLVPSEKEISEQFKVSKITAKNALIGLADEGWLHRIQGKGTFVLAQPLSTETVNQPISAEQPHDFIGLIIPTLKTKVIQNLLDHVEYFLKESGYQLILHITRESSLEETRAIGDLIQCGVKGIIVFPTEDEKYNESLLRLSLDKFNFVFIDRFLRNIETYRVTSDNFGGAYEAAALLLNKGHRRIALISPENTNTAIEDRTSGFEKAYIDQNILINKSLWCHVPLDILRSGGALAYISEFLKNQPTISAVFTLTTEMAKLTYRSFHELDASYLRKELLSFDDPEIPAIPFIMQDEKRMAEAAVELLKLQLIGEYLPQHVVIPVKLICAEADVKTTQ